MFATFDCLFYLVIMMLGGRDYVERVGTVEQVFKRGRLTVGSLQRVGEIFVVDAENMTNLQTVHEATLTLYLVKDRRLAHKTKRHRLLLAAYLCARHTRGAFKVDNAAVGFEIVELAAPVASHGEDVDVQAFYVVNLLTLILFYDDLIGDACGLYSLHTFHERLLHVYLTALTVEGVGGYAHNEIVAKSLGAL